MIPRQNGWSWERRNTKNTNTVAPKIEEWSVQGSVGGPALCTRLVPSPLLRRSWRWNRSSTLAKWVLGLRLLPGFPCCVPRNEPRSCWQHLWVLLVYGNIQRDFLIQMWRENKDFPHDLRLLGDAQQPLGLLRATVDQAGILHQHSEKQHEYFRWAGANKSKWTEGLYPSTINKVHHDWRLQKATCQRLRCGEKPP